MNIPLALLWFLIGFLAVNSLKFSHLRRTMRKLQLNPAYTEYPEAEIMKIAYRKSLPFTPAYYLLVWIVCSTFYFLFHTSPNIYIDALSTGILWWLLTALLEMLLWVKAEHKLRLTWKSMYMNSQPWLSLCYYAVLISPLVLAVILK